MSEKIILKSKKEQQALRESGAILAEVLEMVCTAAKPGVSTYELDQIAENHIRKNGASPSFKGYHGFPATICAAIDEIVVHGIPSESQILQEGDLFTVDCGVYYKGMHSDAARSIGIGKISEEKEKLIATAKLALSNGIAAAMPGNYIGDISYAIDKTIKEAGFKVIPDLTGHGVGHAVHEAPIIPNNWDGKNGVKLKPGMSLAIEPIFSTGSHKIKTLNDNWTIVTNDGSCSVQQENTILITMNGNEVITVKKSLA